MAAIDNRSQEDTKYLHPALRLLDSAFQQMWREAFERKLAPPFDISITDGEGHDVYRATFRKNATGSLSDEAVSSARGFYVPQFPITVVLQDERNRVVQVIVPSLAHELQAK